jgi:transposase
MRTGRLKKPLLVTSEEREKLEMLARRPKSAQAIAMRARIVLGCYSRISNQSVAKKLHVTGATVGKWRERFVRQRLEGLLDEPRPVLHAPSQMPKWKRS